MTTDDLRPNNIARRLTRHHLKKKGLPVADNNVTTSRVTAQPAQSTTTDDKIPEINIPDVRDEDLAVAPGLGGLGRQPEDVIADFNARLLMFADGLSDLTEFPLQMTTRGNELCSEGNVSHAFTHHTDATTMVPSVTLFGSVMTTSIAGDATTSTGEYTTVSSSQNTSSSS